ncbi:MAG TPA: HD domain-containing protein [Firmicutes bacterium]|nr:HD domain-containing protein [Bacillota bacterium]
MISIPHYVRSACTILLNNGFKAYPVGGAVRDSLLGLSPTDWDVTTDAQPEQIEALFAKTVPTGKQFGTVTVLLENKPLEITTMRVEGPYSDGRRPDRVDFTKDIETDLSRRDFTVNAIAYDTANRRFIDPYRGRRDLKRKQLRAVGEAACRFQEDPLRMLRLIRFQAVLGFKAERKTIRAVKAPLINRVSPERIGAELSKMLVGPHLGPALKAFYTTGLMHEIIPELAAGRGVSPGERHPYDLLGHSITAAHFAEPTLHLRWAALLHDLGKIKDPGRRHAAAGSELAGQILRRLRYSTKLINSVRFLIKHHMFHCHPYSSEKALRRFLAKVGREAAFDLVKLRQADMAGMNADPREIIAFGRGLEKRLAAILKQAAALSLADLAVDGSSLMNALALKPGPLIGEILNYLLEQVLADPNLNQRESLVQLARDFLKSKQ